MTDTQIPKLESESSLHRLWFYDGKGNLSGFLPFLGKSIPSDPPLPPPLVSSLPPCLQSWLNNNLCSQYSPLPSRSKVSAVRFPHHSPETAVVKGITCFCLKAAESLVLSRSPSQLTCQGHWPQLAIFSWAFRISDLPPLSLCLVLSQFPDLIIIQVAQGPVLGPLLSSVSTCTPAVNCLITITLRVCLQHPPPWNPGLYVQPTQSSYIPHRVLPFPCTLPLSLSSSLVMEASSLVAQGLNCAIVLEPFCY